MLSFCFGTFSGCQGGSEGHFRLDPTSENATWRQNGFTCRKKTADFGRTISLLNAENRAHICQGTVDILGAFSGNISATHNSAIGNVNRLVIVLQVMFYVTYDAVFTASVPSSGMTKRCVADAKLHYFFKAEKTSTSSCCGATGKHQLVLCFNISQNSKC